MDYDWQTILHAMKSVACMYKVYKKCIKACNGEHIGERVFDTVMSFMLGELI